MLSEDIGGRRGLVSERIPGILKMEDMWLDGPLWRSRDMDGCNAAFTNSRAMAMTWGC
jgi:hypothetical protein